MSFTFYDNIPTGPDNPSDDQPLMLQNNIATKGLIAVDHITFGTLGGGEHQKVTFNSRTLPSAQTDPKSVLYTNTVTATATNTASASTVSELFFRNQNAGAGVTAFSFPISMIKAFGLFDGAGNPLNTWNMSITLPAGHPSAGKFIIDLPANIVTGTNYLVFITNTGTNTETSLANNYVILSATQFRVEFLKVGVNFFDPNRFSVMIMQL